MAGISSKALNGTSENKIKFNGYEQQNKEFGDGSGLEWYDYKNRFYDNQTGRFFCVDRLASEYAYYTPYQFAGNEVPNAIDLDGLEPLRMSDQGILGPSDRLRVPIGPSEWVMPAGNSKRGGEGGLTGGIPMAGEGGQGNARKGSNNGDRTVNINGLVALTSGFGKLASFAGGELLDYVKVLEKVKDIVELVESTKNNSNDQPEKSSNSTNNPTAPDNLSPKPEKEQRETIKLHFDKTSAEKEKGPGQVFSGRSTPGVPDTIFFSNKKKSN